MSDEHIDPCTISADPYFFYLKIPGQSTISIPTHRGDILARILAARTLAREKHMRVRIGQAGAPTQEMVNALLRGFKGSVKLSRELEDRKRAEELCRELNIEGLKL